MTKWVTVTLNIQRYSDEHGIRAQKIQDLAKHFTEELDNHTVLATENEIIIHQSWSIENRKKDLRKTLSEAPPGLTGQITFVTVHLGNDNSRPGTILVYKNIGTTLLEEIQEISYGPGEHLDSFKQARKQIKNKEETIKAYNKPESDSFPTTQKVNQ